MFIHITWHEFEDYGRIPSNGLLIVKDGQAIMVDTPMDNEKTESLTTYIEENFHVKVVKLIASHYHDDCIGGLSYLQEKGVESIANSMTIDKCKELGLPAPAVGFTKLLNIDFNGEKIECRFFGGGHTSDNIVVWLPQQQILFGGCMIKSADAVNLGNIADAVLDEWGDSIQQIQAQYKNIAVVVPGHGSSGGTELLNHTLELLKTSEY